MSAFVTTSTQKNTYPSKNSLDLEAEEKKGRRQAKVGVYLRKYSVPTAINIIGTVVAIPLVATGAYYASQGNEDLELIMDGGFAVGGVSAAAAAIYTAATNIKNESTTVVKYIK